MFLHLLRLLVCNLYQWCFVIFDVGLAPPWSDFVLSTVFFYATLQELVSSFPLQAVHCQGIEIGRRLRGPEEVKSKQPPFIYGVSRKW